MIGLNKIFFRFFLLIVTVFIFDVFFNTISWVVIHNLIENILFAIIIILPLYFFKNNKLITYYSALTFTLFFLCLYFETVYYHLFKTYFSSSAFFVTLDSNLDETSEFFQFYIDIPILVLTFILSTLAFYFLKKPVNLEIRSKNISIKNNFKVIGLFVLILIFLKVSALIVFNLPYLIIKSGFEYHIESKKLGDYKNNLTGNFKNVTRLSANDDELYVIIIGESTSRSHLSLYNYYRGTTPELDQLKSDLLIYNNVISPHAYSVGSLTKILTLGNYENPQKVSTGSIIQLANKVNFQTYWISNQRPIGPYESLITKISLSAKNYKFLTTTIAGVSKVLDGDLIPEFDKVLSNKEKRKVVFVHLMGTHHHYENRYPEAFNKFKNEPDIKFKSEENFDKVNHYDNAVLYNDFIISSIIKKTDSLKTKSFVLYFSDHGEEMFDELNMAGHNEDIYSKKMFEIPFILWQSKKYKQDRNLLFVENRKYMIDDLFHGIADLLDINATEVEANRSIFNKSFKERERIIKDTINFDTYFK